MAATPDRLRFIERSSRLGQRIADFPWHTHPLGPAADWPPALKIAVGLVVRSGFPKCLCWGPDMTMLYNDAFQDLLGDKGDCLGQTFASVWSECWDEIGPIAHKALAGESTFIPDFPLNIHRDTDELAFFTFAYSPIVDEEGRVMGFMDTVIETTQRVAQERSTILRNEELQHRIKNSYSVMSAIASHSFRESSNPSDIRRRLMGRVRALGRAHDMLAHGHTACGLMHDVIQNAISPMLNGWTDRVSLNGPALQLTEAQTFALSLALHELVTNSLKYGAVSCESGQISLSWSGDAGGLRALVWQEKGGPVVAEPTTSGFGTFLIRDALAAAFDGTAELAYPASGLVFRLVAQPRPDLALAVG